MLKLNLEWYYLHWKYSVVINGILVSFLAKCGFWVAAVMTWPVSATGLRGGWGEESSKGSRWKKAQPEKFCRNCYVSLYFLSQTRGRCSDIKTKVGDIIPTNILKRAIKNKWKIFKNLVLLLKTEALTLVLSPAENRILYFERIHLYLHTL